MTPNEIVNILNRVDLTDKDKMMFNELKDNYYITSKLFYKNDILYSIKILYKENHIFWQLKQNRKIILETKNCKTLKNRILKILHD